MRDFFLRGCVALGIATALITELLSPFHLLRRGPLMFAWFLILAAWLIILAAWLRIPAARFAGRPKLAWFTIRRLAIRRLATHPMEEAIALACAAIVAVVALTAYLSPPNSADAMAYHMPRVIYWAQAGSVAFFPTPYFNQISLQPLAEYFALHTYLLSGGDRFVNLLTCAAFLAAIVAVSALAGALGAGTRGQAFAALFCATLPNGILQASGAKNEWMLALWLICAGYFAARKDAPFTGLSLGLALATKASAYLFAPPLVLAILLIRLPLVRVRSLSHGPAITARARIWRAGDTFSEWRAEAHPTGDIDCSWWGGLQPAKAGSKLACVWLACIAAGVLLVNTPQYLRNLRLSGSPLGYDSAQGDGVFRWRNEHPGVKSTISNLIRHTSDQLGGRSRQWNQTVFQAAIALHRALGIDPGDRDTTWPYATFAPPLNSNHEANANNRWHLLLLGIAAAFAAMARKRTWIVYGAGLVVAYLLFCFYLKWQPFMGRLELPLFVLAAPLAGAFLEAMRPAILAIFVALFLVGNTRLPLFQNWTRPLAGPHSLWVTARDDNYFRDMVQWDNRASYLSAVDLTARSGCTAVGIDIGQNQLEYPFQALLRERNPAVRFMHTGVENASARYTPAGQLPPCAVFCPDCAGIPRKMALYAIGPGAIGPPVEIGHFLLFLRSAK